MSTVSCKIEDARELPDVAERAINMNQLVRVTQLVDGLCEAGSLTDKSMMKMNPDGMKVANGNRGMPFTYNKWDGNTKSLGAFAAEINMYDIIEHIIKPICQGPDSGNNYGRVIFPNGCSYVETITETPQPPNIFVSQFFGQPFAIFISTLTEYMKKRNLDNRAGLWISCFAHRLWDMDQEQDLLAVNQKMPFLAALQHPKITGTALITSKDCLAMERVWCLFELSKGMQKRNHRVDIALGSAGEDASVCIIGTNGNSIGIEDMSHDTWDKLLRFRVESSSAAKFADKHLLTKMIPGAREFDTAVKQRIMSEALDSAIVSGDSGLVRKLLEYDVHVNVLTYGDRTPLHQAVDRSKHEVASVLLDAKADVNDQRNPLKKTPLHLAREESIIQLLLSHNANRTLEDNYGNVAYEAPPEQPQQQQAQQQEEEMQVVAVAEQAAEDTTEQKEEEFQDFENLLGVLCNCDFSEVQEHTNLNNKVGPSIKWRSPLSGVSAALTA